MNQSIKSILLTSIACSSFCSAGCQSFPQTELNKTINTPVVFDGEMDEWSGHTNAWADGRYIYLHFTPTGVDAQTIQAAPYTTRIRIDTDNDQSTGQPMSTLNMTGAILPPQGVDLLIELSPKNEIGSIGIGSGVSGFTPAGDLVVMGHADLGFAFLPTYLAEAYEARIDRHGPGAQMLQGSGPINIVIDQVNINDGFRWSTPTINLNLPALQPIKPSPSMLPIKPKAGVRMMSTNVLFSSPLSEPDAFARVLGAINPDVILYQEWFNTNPSAVQNWLDTYAGKGWDLHMPSSRDGVAIATKNPIIARYDEVLPPSGEGRPARAVAALIQTDVGELLAISVHLKCCGNAGSSEDIKRIEQAQAINAFVQSVQKKHPHAKLVIAGDFNLVGSRIPLDTMADSLAVDGTALTPVKTLHIGDNSMVTWIDEKSRFSPGRLDWMLYDNAISTAANAFVLDTRNLSAKSLAALGLQVDDTKASDHLPIILDLVDP